MPQFGFNTNFHFDQFPILHGTLDTLLPVGGPNVPPRNHPYAAFSDDSPWQITYDGVLYLEQILRCPTQGSRLTNYGLFLDPPVHLPARQVIHERVLLLGVPNSFNNDPRVTLVYSTVWRMMLGLHHSSVTDRMGVCAGSPITSRRSTFSSRGEITKSHQVRETVEYYFETLRRKCWVVNTITKEVHLPGVSETR